MRPIGDRSIVGALYVLASISSVMWNALFAFEDPAGADEAAHALIASGFPSAGLTMHTRASGPRGGAVEQIDEQVTGGILSNFYNLFQGVLDWGDSPHDASAFEDVVIRGGVVLEVNANDVERDAVDAALERMTPLRTEWRDKAR